MEDFASAEIAHVLTRVAQLPSPLGDALARTFRKDTLSLADAGRPFRGDCVVIEEAEARLPSRRLRFAFRTSRFYVVHYEAGGYESAAKTLVFSYPSRGSIPLVWGGVSWAPAKTPAELIDRIRRGKLMDEPRTIW
jgi:hypothetical protein